MQTLKRLVFSILIITLTLVCLFLGPSVSYTHAQMYRWTTPNGTVAFGDRLPRTGTPANLTRLRERCLGR